MFYLLFVFILCIESLCVCVCLGLYEWFSVDRPINLGRFKVMQERRSRKYIHISNVVILYIYRFKALRFYADGANEDTHLCIVLSLVHLCRRLLPLLSFVRCCMRRTPLFAYAHGNVDLGRHEESANSF